MLKVDHLAYVLFEIIQTLIELFNFWFQVYIFKIYDPVFYIVASIMEVVV